MYNKERKTAGTIGFNRTGRVSPEKAVEIGTSVFVSGAGSVDSGYSINHEHFLPQTANHTSG
jgi:hypothetical protein